MHNENRIMTLHPAGKKGVNILKRRYETIKSYIIKSLEKHNEMTYQKLSDDAERDLSKTFDGKVVWYVVSVKLDLEARNIIGRIPKTSQHKIRLVG